MDAHAALLQSQMEIFQGLPSGPNEHSLLCFFIDTYVIDIHEFISPPDPRSLENRYVCNGSSAKYLAPAMMMNQLSLPPSDF